MESKNHYMLRKCMNGRENHMEAEMTLKYLDFHKRQNYHLFFIPRRPTNSLVSQCSEEKKRKEIGLSNPDSLLCLHIFG